MGEILQFKLNNKKPNENPQKGDDQLLLQNNNNILKFPKKESTEITSVLTDERTGEQIILSGRQQKRLASFFKRIVQIGKEKLDPTDLENNRSRNMLNCALRATDEELQKEPRFYFLITQILIDRLKK